MGYAGYAPAKLPVDLTPAQKALKAVANMESLDVIGKLVYNAACNPTDDKYKAVKTSNARISSLVMQEPGALDAMKAMGWQETEETLRCTKVPNMAQFRDVEAAKNNLKKDLRTAEVAKLRKASGAA